MCRCEICNFASFDDKYCVDNLGDIRAASTTVHYYPELKQELCQYCFRLVNKHRKFYSWYYRKEDKFTHGLGLNKSKFGSKPNDQKTAPKVPEMSE